MGRRRVAVVAGGAAPPRCRTAATPASRAAAAPARILTGWPCEAGVCEPVEVMVHEHDGVRGEEHIATERDRAHPRTRGGGHGTHLPLLLCLEASVVAKHHDHRGGGQRALPPLRPVWLPQQELLRHHLRDEVARSAQQQQQRRWPTRRTGRRLAPCRRGLGMRLERTPHSVEHAPRPRAEAAGGTARPSLHRRPPRRRGGACRQRVACRLCLCLGGGGALSLRDGA
eukprot:scaffold80443_cov63-Phaeocystis_antarctica.AAC.3